MSAVKITNKRQMQALLAEGAFGNTTRLWPDIPSYQRDTFEGTVALRSLLPGQPMYPFMEREQIEDFLVQSHDFTLHQDWRSYYVQEVVAPSHIVIAGELTRNECGLLLQRTAHQGRYGRPVSGNNGARSHSPVYL